MQLHITCSWKALGLKNRMTGPLGKKVNTPTSFSPDILFPIEREQQRHRFGLDVMSGEDIWNLHEIHWLDHENKALFSWSNQWISWRFHISSPLITSRPNLCRCCSLSIGKRISGEKEVGVLTFFPKGPVILFFNPNAFQEQVICNCILPAPERHWG